MKRILWAALLVIVLLVFTAPIILDQINIYIDRRADARIVNSNRDLSKDIGEISKKIEDATKEINVLEFNQALDSDQTSVLARSTAAINTDDSGYGVVQTTFGPFVIIGKSATQYLDGYKVKISIGNLTGFTMHGAKIHVQWGGYFRDSDDIVKDKEKKSVDKEKEFDIQDVFRPGSYATFDLFLTPATPDEVKQISVSAKFNVISPG